MTLRNSQNGSNGAPKRPNKQPNIVLIVADDHRMQSIAGYGNEEVLTPTFDRLMKEGVHFHRTYIMGGVAAAVCVPTRAAIHTGIGCFRSTMSREVESGRPLVTLRPEHTTLGQAFRQAGYTTFGVGKWHNDKESYARSFQGGAKIFFGGGGDHRQIMVHDYDPTGAFPQEARYVDGRFSTDMFADAAVDFIRGAAEQEPFFLYVAFTAPHDPRTPVEPFASMYDPETLRLPANATPIHPFDNGEMEIRDELLAAWPREQSAIRRHLADYYGMIAHLDDRIGDIVKALDERGIADDTIVVYTADHGISIGQHGLMGKQNMYDHSVRIPFILRGGGLPADRRIDALIQQIDIYPTLCELAGLTAPEAVDGISAASLIRGETDRHRDTVGAVYKDVQRMISDGRWKLIRYTHSAKRGVGTDVEQLFDTLADPWETCNLAGLSAYRELKQQLSDRLDEWMRRNDDPLLEGRV
ncbi:MAG: Choline-sulfatase [Paenibacillaceae bacterium]|jgi:arylsulfatase A-like enzyme|nr:Choline-sulfatase [Paenibacillaceae bacterium]